MSILIQCSKFVIRYFSMYEYPCLNAGGEESLVGKLMVISEVSVISIQRFFSRSSYRMAEGGGGEFLWLI